MTTPPDDPRADEGLVAQNIAKHVASLRALSDWLIANDLDMKLPDTVDCDPDDTADLLAALAAARSHGGM